LPRHESGFGPGKTTEGIAPRRTVLDKILLDGAVDARVAMEIFYGLTTTTVYAAGPC